MALAMGSDDGAQLRCDLETLERRFSQTPVATRYYTPEIHGAALALPAFMKAALQAPAQPIQN
jgi:spermidine synthase